jgi:hypothetical protein
MRVWARVIYALFGPLGTASVCGSQGNSWRVELPSVYSPDPGILWRAIFGLAHHAGGLLRGLLSLSNGSRNDLTTGLWLSASQSHVYQLQLADFSHRTQVA